MRRAAHHALPTKAAGVTGVIAALVVLAGLASPLTAQRSLLIEHLHADIEVRESGDLVVSETLRPRFEGEWNGIARRIVLRHTTAAGEAERLEVEPLDAVDEHGRPLRMEEDMVESDVLEVRVWIPDARDRTAPFTLRYRVRGAIRYFAGTAAEPDSAAAGPAGSAAAAGSAGSAGSGASAGPAGGYDELYWEVTGTGWEVPIQNASVRIALPEGAEVLQAAAYRGVEGSSEPLPVGMPDERPDLDPNEVVVPGSGHLRPGQGLTVAVAWPAGVVVKPADVARSAPVTFGPTGSVRPAAAGPGPLTSASLLALLPLLLPFLVFWIAYRAWARRGRDPKERAITVQWEPPAGLSAAEAGTLVDHHPGMYDIIATLVDLAVRGYVVISERGKAGLFRSGKDYALHLVRPRSEWDGLSAHERLFLEGLFQRAPRSHALANLAREGTFLDDVLETFAGEPPSDSAPDDAIDSVLLSDLQNRFYKEIPRIRDALLDALVEKGYYLRRPDRARARWAGMAAASLFLAGLAVPALALGTATGFVLAATTALAAALSALILAIFAFLMPARTRDGARAREAILGFKRFLERVEAPRYRRMIRSPDQFERYLPYAMAFRCADKWAAAFDDLLTQPPDWYHGHPGRPFRPTVFAGDLGTLASTATSTLASSPSSSSGSGGGGSVGGGSGGGGGGGF